MKKLMFTAAAALCATVGFAIESANTVGYLQNELSATTVSGKDRICIVKTFYSEEKKKEIEKEPENYFGRGFISILGRTIEFYDGDISLYYEEEFNADFTRQHRQTYNSKSGKWSKDELNEYYWN